MSSSWCKLISPRPKVPGAYSVAESGFILVCESNEVQPIGVAEHLLSVDSVQHTADIGVGKTGKVIGAWKCTSYQPLADDGSIHHFTREREAYRILTAGPIGRNSTRKRNGTESDGSWGQVRNISQVTREGTVKAERPALPRWALGGDTQDRGEFKAKKPE